MVNAVFLDYKTLFNADAEDITSASFYALKDVVNKSDNIRIICLNTDDELAKRFDYDFWLDQLSQFLNLKKSLFFVFGGLFGEWFTDFYYLCPL